MLWDENVFKKPQSQLQPLTRFFLNLGVDDFSDKGSKDDHSEDDVEPDAAVVGVQDARLYGEDIVEGDAEAQAVYDSIEQRLVDDIRYGRSPGTRQVVWFDTKVLFQPRKQEHQMKATGVPALGGALCRPSFASACKRLARRSSVRPVNSFPERKESEARSASVGEGDEGEALSGEVVVYGSAVFLTFGTFLVWFLFRDPIEDLIYGGRLFSLFEVPVSLGDVSAVLLWTVAYFFASPLQLLFVFLGRFERERPSDWILRRLGLLFNQPVDDASYSPSESLIAATWLSVFVIALTTAAVFKAAFGDATWGVSTGIGACMAAGVFEISRPERMSASRKEVLDAQFADFAQFAEARLQPTGSCHESEVFAAFRTEVEGYRDPENPSDLTLRRFVQQWAPQSKRTGKGFLKKLSVKPRVDPFR